MKAITSITFVDSDACEAIDTDTMLSGLLHLVPGTTFRITGLPQKTIKYQIAQVLRELTFDPALGGSLRERLTVRCNKV